MGIESKESVQRRRGYELRMHLVRSRSVTLIKVFAIVVPKSIDCH